jgi:hypothetical protein
LKRRTASLIGSNSAVPPYCCGNTCRHRHTRKVSRCHIGMYRIVASYSCNPCINTHSEHQQAHAEAFSSLLSSMFAKAQLPRLPNSQNVLRAQVDACKSSSNIKTSVQHCNCTPSTMPAHVMVCVLPLPQGCPHLWWHCVLQLLQV